MGIEEIFRIPILRQQAERLSRLLSMSLAACRGGEKESVADDPSAAVAGLVAMSQGNQAAQKHVRRGRRKW